MFGIWKGLYSVKHPSSFKLKFYIQQNLPFYSSFNMKIYVSVYWYLTECLICLVWGLYFMKMQSTIKKKLMSKTNEDNSDMVIVQTLSAMASTLSFVHLRSSSVTRRSWKSRSASCAHNRTKPSTSRLSSGLEWIIYWKIWNSFNHILQFCRSHNRSKLFI